MLESLPDWVTGGAGGAVVTGAVVAVVKALARRSDASSLMQEAAAFGFKTLAEQVSSLQREVVELREELDAEREQRRHWQERFHEEAAAHTATRQMADRLKLEWEADKAKPAYKSERPGPNSQRKV